MRIGVQRMSLISCCEDKEDNETRIKKNRHKVCVATSLTWARTVSWVTLIHLMAHVYYLIS